MSTVAWPDLGKPVARPELRRADGQRVRVLVVDDESTLTELLSMALRLEGWEVQAGGNGFGALRSARSFEPDAVVLDMMLPDMDGLEVLRKLRAGAGRTGALPHRQGRTGMASEPGGPPG